MANAAEEQVRRIEELVRQLGEIQDAECRELAHSLVGEILELHGAGLERMMDAVFEAGDSGRATIRRFANDPLVASLLVLHGLHPDDLETRVTQALAKTHSSAELVGVFEGSVHVRLTGTGCGLRAAVEAAIREAAPDAVDIVVIEEASRSGFVPLGALTAGGVY